MLRPALLLPPKRLLSPRCGLRDPSRRLGPATRRSDAYRDGTFTRWFGAASSTRHAPTLALGQRWHVLVGAILSAVSMAVTGDVAGVQRSDNPHSVDFRNRATARRSTNDEIDAGETGNPHSVDFKSSVAPRHWATKDEINAAESGSPDSAGNK